MTTPTPTPEMDNIVVACADLVGRAGARGFQIGYLHDDVPADQAGWYAHAQYRGARITTQDHPGPAEAADALARKILTGGRCRCGRLVALDTSGAVACANATMADGSTWTVDQAAAAGQCLWTRTGNRWNPSCPEPGGTKVAMQGQDGTWHDLGPYIRDARMTTAAVVQPAPRRCPRCGGTCSNRTACRRGRR